MQITGRGVAKKLFVLPEVVVEAAVESEVQRARSDSAVTGSHRINEGMNER